MTTRPRSAVLDHAIEARWSSWRLERNRTGTRALLWIAGLLYPLFGITDYLLAPPDALWILLVTRVLVTTLTFTLLGLLGTSLFRRFPHVYSAGYLVIAGMGITLMTVFMGGLASIYYAGLSMVLVASGLLFVWPPRVVAVTYSAVVASFIGVNLVVNGWPTDVFQSVANLFFLLSIALLTAVGQLLSYQSLHDQVANQVLIERTGEALQAANAQLKLIDEQKAKFFSNITHEFKTPLTIVMTPLQNLIHAGANTPATLEASKVQTMYRACMQVLKMVDDLLDLARSQEAQLHLRLAERDLVQYLSAMMVDVQVLAHRKNIELTFVSAVPSATVWCDVERLDRVFVNLLANALKFTPEHGRVGVVVWDDGDRVVVQVCDTGPGFPEELAAKVFERFYQVDAGSTRSHGGAGIGLALAREIVLLHGGTIAAAAAPGFGATFTVSLRRGRSHFVFPPTDDVPAPSEGNGVRGLAGLALPDPLRYRLLDIETATEKRRVPRDPDEGRFRHTILVVEDNDDVIHAINETLAGEYRVYAAADGEEGFERAIKHSPHLIITDYMMPRMNGLELMRRLREDPRTRLTPVILLTALGDVQSKIQGIDGGASAYLAKPFDTQELLSTVRRHLETHANNAEALLHKQLDSLEVITSGLAHQINNPLNYMKTALKVIQRDTAEALAMAATEIEDPAGRESLNKIERRITRMFSTADVGVRRIGDTVELMRRYSRDGYQRVAERYAIFDAARTALRLVLPTAETDVHVETAFTGPGFIDCVPDEVNQVLTNLIQNAIDALNANGGGTLSVIGSADDHEVRLCIRDTGTGIPPDVRARIFTPFFTTKGPGRGMGMGLFICHRIVTALGGSIAVDSTPGSGTEMVLRLPASRVSRAHAAEGATA